MMKMLLQPFYDKNVMFVREKKVIWLNTSYELRVESLKTGVESLTARVEIQKYEFRFQIYELRFQIHELGV